MIHAAGGYSTYLVYMIHAFPVSVWKQYSQQKKRRSTKVKMERPTTTKTEQVWKWLVPCCRWRCCWIKFQTENCDCNVMSILWGKNWTEMDQVNFRALDKKKIGKLGFNYLVTWVLSTSMGDGWVAFQRIKFAYRLGKYPVSKSKSQHTQP
jgi:hypothetical protein